MRLLRRRFGFPAEAAVFYIVFDNSAIRKSENAAEQCKFTRLLNMEAYDTAVLSGAWEASSIWKSTMAPWSRRACNSKKFEATYAKHILLTAVVMPEPSTAKLPVIAWSFGMAVIRNAHEKEGK